MWNWQQDDWPHFQYDKKAIEELEAKFLQQSGMNLGAFKHISDEDKELLKVELSCPHIMSPENKLVLRG